MVSVAVCIVATFLVTIINLVLNMSVAYIPNAPNLPGIMPSLDVPRIILGVAPDWKNYLGLTRGDKGDDVFSGSLVEMVQLMQNVLPPPPGTKRHL